MELSFGEMLLIVVIAFLVLGPDEMVRQAAKLGRWVNKIKTEIDNFKVLTKEQMDKSIKTVEIDGQEIHKKLTKIKKKIEGSDHD